MTTTTAHRSRTPCQANEAIEMEVALSKTECPAMISAAAAKHWELFNIFYIDHRNDHNTHKILNQINFMYAGEMLHGQFVKLLILNSFSINKNFNQLTLIDPPDIRSTYAQQLISIYGNAYIGILSAKDGKVIGASKYDRIVDHFFYRFQIQERLIRQISQFILNHIAPRGVAVRIKALDMCKMHQASAPAIATA